MQTEQIRQCVDKIEECADEAMRAMKASASVPQDLRDCLQSLHRQASDAKKQPMMDDAMYRECVVQLEQMGDDAMRMCRGASGLDAQLQDAVKKLHGELSRQKHDAAAHA